MTNLPRPSLIGRTIALTIATAATLVIVAGSAAPAVAAPVANPQSAVIDLAGIDLASPAGEARIADAVSRAARRICADGDRSLAARAARRACIDTALASAMPRLDALAEAARASRFALADASPPTDQVRR